MCSSFPTSSKALICRRQCRRRYPTAWTLVHIPTLFSLSPPCLPRQNPAALSATKFVWWNSHHQPYGFPLPLACPVCCAVRPWKEFLSLPSRWTTECGNPGCGLRSDGSREQAAGKLSGTKPDGFAFVMPTKKRTSGWLSLDISSQFV